MTAVNAGVHELAGVRLPYSGGHAVFMYSTAADGNVTLQLRDSDDLDRSGLAAMLARLQDDATLSISYQDSDILSDGTIDVLLGAGTGSIQPSGGGDGVTAAFDLFDSSSGPDLTLSPQTFTNSAEAFINDNSNSLGVPADNDTVSTSDDKKSANAASEVVKLSVKRARPKAASPNRQGPQQCQVCAKVFGNASALAKHKLTHSDERKYVCTMCGKAFKRQDHLNGHMLTHRNKKPYECKAEGCGKSYCDARSLRRHTENHHSSATVTTTNMSPAQGAASGDAASPHGSSCIQYAPPPTPAAKSQLQQLLATEPAKTGGSGNNDGLTKQQLDLIHQIMEQTQRQSQPAATASTKTTTKPVTKTVTKQPATKIQRVWSSPTQHSSSNKTSGSNSTSPQAKVSTTAPASSVPAASNSAKPEPKPVECNLCHRKFKNIPALNGHMRLHGGYFKKDAENKKCEKKEVSGPPLQTASVSVRALIEEKIINKRITNPQTSTTSGETSRSTAPPLFPLTVHSTTDGEPKVSSFVVPAPPQTTTEKTRRHSDAETFTVPRVPSTQQEAEVLADLILKRSKVAVKRTASDPGKPSQQIQLQIQPGDAFTLAGVTYQAEDGDYFAPSLQEEVFTQVQDTMLLQGVDAQQLASMQFQTDSLLPDQTDDQLQDIGSLEEYATVTASLQDTVVDSPSYPTSHSVNQDLQAVLDSPLPESLAEFSTFHSSNNLDLPSPGYQTNSPAQYTGSPHASLATQSPLQSPLIRHDSPGFAYPTPPASHEGQSPSFGQNSIFPMISPQQTEFGQVINRDPDDLPQPSSPLSAAFFTSTMSSSAAVEEALEEVLPGESISPDDIYPSLSNSPPPQSPLSVGLTPVPSPLSSIPTSTSSVSSPHPPNAFTPSPANLTFPMSPHYTLQSQMMPNSDDPLLSSSPKDFATRKRFEFNGFQSFKVVGNNLIDFSNPNLAGILVDSNGELKFIQTGNNSFQAKNIILAGSSMSSQQSQCVPKDVTADLKLINQKYQKTNKTIQCIIPTNKNLIQRPKLNVDVIKQEEPDDVFLSPTTVPASPVRMSRKRPRSEPLQLPILHQSRLRAARGKPMGSAPYTPTPMLNPSRPGPGLYWTAKLRTTAHHTHDNSDDSSTSWSTDSVPESDSTPHINVGPEYQCSVPCSPGHDRIDREPTYEHLLWDPGINATCTNAEVDMYLDFACCAAVPGGGRNKEYALHLLNLCGGNIHDAMLRLMQPAPSLPPDHPLLHYQYSESDRWTSTETDAFYQALLKHDKDFFAVAQEIGTKTVKQCVQFYYVWKKVCTDEYRKVRQARDRRHGNVKIDSESDLDDKPFPDSKLLGIADTESPLPAPEHRHFMCEFSECSASFNSRAALNGHIRIHGGTARRSPTPTSNPERRTHTTTPIPCTGDTTEDYPCKICGKVFSKIKSRSAHMKSHRPPDAEPKRRNEPPSMSYDTTSSP